MTAWQSVALVLFAPLLQGWIRVLKARMQGRRGPSIWQPYRDLRKYFRKGLVVSDSTSWVTGLAPYTVAGLLLTACTMIPVATVSSPLLAGGSLFAFLYTLAFARAGMVLLSLDSGSAFAGMAAGRDLLFATVAEPAAFLALLALGLPHASFTFADLIRPNPFSTPAAIPVQALALAALFLVILAETGRLPVDNPDTHLELTMVHEGLLLEATGRHLALVTWSAHVRQALWFTVVIDACMPWGIARGAGTVGDLTGLVVWFVKCLALGLLVAAVESVSAKWRVFLVPRYLSFALSLAVAAILAGSVLSIG